MKMLILGLFCCCLSENIFAQSPKSTNQKSLYMGIRYKDYHELKGLVKINSTAINLHYGVAHLKKEEKNLLLLSRFENSNKHNDDFQLKVIDVVELPNFNDAYYTISVKGCSVNGKNDPTVFALAIKEEKKFLTKIPKTWKLDKETGKINDFQSVGVKCLNLNYDDVAVE